MNNQRIPKGDNWKIYMEQCSENDFKTKICTLLNDDVQKDWGGEMNDHFASLIHANGKRTSAAFLFKDPAKFSEMKITHLGKNGNQIARLMKTPAELVILQHCHLITEYVREMLEIYAQRFKKKFCIINGKESYVILKAYNLL